MKKTKSPIYFRYEFSDEKGAPEGGDIFQFSSLNQAQEMMGEVLKVAQSDNVTVSLTVGQEVPFFGFLKKNGVSRKDAEREMVGSYVVPFTPEKAAPKKKAKAPTKAKKK